MSFDDDIIDWQIMLTQGNAYLHKDALLLRTRDYNLAVSALVAAASKIKLGVFGKD